MTKADEQLIDDLIEENRELRETIRQCLIENQKLDRYWREFVLKLMEQKAADPT